MSGLQGKKIALLEARMSSELANLIKRQGGEPINAPALKEVAIDAKIEVATFIDNLQAGKTPIVIFQTGVGVAGLLAEAEQLGRKTELLGLLQNCTIVCRGPKPIAVLARNGIKPTIVANEPYTTTDLIAALATIDVANQGIAVLHYGERNAQLAEALLARGAILQELCLYEWQMPEDIAPLKQLIADVCAGTVDSVAFTSQIQARHLFAIASSIGRADELRTAMNEKTIVASIGPTCTSALIQLGVTPRIEPEHPKMGFLVIAMQEHFLAN